MIKQQPLEVMLFAMPVSMSSLLDVCKSVVAMSKEEPDPVVVEAGIDAGFLVAMAGSCNNRKLAEIIASKKRLCDRLQSDLAKSQSKWLMDLSAMVNSIKAKNSVDAILRLHNLV